MASGLCRFVAAAARNMITANTFGSFSFLVLFGLGGFVLSRGTYKSTNIKRQPYYLFIYFSLIGDKLNILLYLLYFTDDINKWWIWGYWVSPMMYGQNAIVANEFSGRSWRHVIFRNDSFVNYEFVLK